MNDRPELDKRKAFILATVVYEYINTAEPVGSVALTQKYNLGVSSATIRNEMAELETQGYLVQPHTSAGRIPSDSGYRTYVDQLMKPEPLEEMDARRIRDQFREASRELDGVIDQATRLLSGLSRNVAIAIAPARDTHAFKHVQLLWLSARTSLIVIVTSMGVAAQESVEWQSDVDADALTRLSNALNAVLGGSVMEDISPAAIDRVCDSRARLRRNPRGAARRVPQRTPQRSADLGIGRAEFARPAGVSRFAQTALDSQDRRRAEDALRS